MACWPKFAISSNDLGVWLLAQNFEAVVAVEAQSAGDPTFTIIVQDASATFSDSHKYTCYSFGDETKPGDKVRRLGGAGCGLGDGGKRNVC